MSLEQLLRLYPSGFNAWSTTEFPKIDHPGYEGNWYPIADTEVQFNKAGNKDAPSPSYKCNSHGFRTRDLSEVLTSQKPKILTLGCSFTFGLGIPQELSWPELLGKDLGMEVVNLGIPAASGDVMARIAYQVVPRLKNCHLIVALFPDMSRLEALSKIHLENDLPPDCITKLRMELSGIWSKPARLSALQREAYLEGMNDEVKSFFQFIRAWTQLNAVTKLNHVPLVWSIWDRRVLELSDEALSSYVNTASFVRKSWMVGKEVLSRLARDGMHPGVSHHREFADMLKTYCDRFWRTA